MVDEFKRQAEDILGDEDSFEINHLWSYSQYYTLVLQPNSTQLLSRQSLFYNFLDVDSRLSETISQFLKPLHPLLNVFCFLRLQLDVRHLVLLFLLELEDGILLGGEHLLLQVRFLFGELLQILIELIVENIGVLLLPFQSPHDLFSTFHDFVGLLL